MIIDITGTTLVPGFPGTRKTRYRAHPVHSTTLVGFDALLKGDVKKLRLLPCTYRQLSDGGEAFSPVLILAYVFY